MNREDLIEQLNIELELIETTLRELSALHADVVNKEPTVREKTAAAGFMAQFYGGVENILKRINSFYGLPLPTAETWHIELFKRFCSLPYPPLPVLFDAQLELSMAPFRKFRHVVHHGYGFQLDWARMSEGITVIDLVYQQFKKQLNAFIQTLEQ